MENFRSEENKIAKKEIKDFSYLKKTLIITGVVAVLAIIIGIGFIISGDTAEKGSTIGGFIAFIVLLYLAVVQLLWGTEPIVSIFSLAFKKPGSGIIWIMSMDIDGIIRFIVFKLVLAILAGLLSIFMFLLGAGLCMLVAPFSFPFALNFAIKHPSEISVF